MSEESPEKRREAFAGLHLIVLFSLAAAPPIYHLLARHAGFFVVRRSEPIDVLILAGTLSLLLPVAAAGAVALLRRLYRPAGVLCHRLVVAALIAMLALQAGKRLVEVPGALMIILAAAAGVGGAVAYHRLPAARLFLTLLSPAIAVFPAVFLLDPAVSRIVRPPHVEAIADLEMRPEADTPVVLIVFDALPVTSLMTSEGEVDGARFPSFARLAAGATWYRNATTVSADTIWAVPAILTGNYPDVSRQPSFHHHPRNLFTLLGGSYRLVLFEHLTDLCPAELCPRQIVPLGRRLRELASDLRVVFLHVLLPGDLTASLPRISQAWGDFGIADTKPGQQNRRRKFRLFLRAIDPEKPHGLYFLHSLFPHAPYQYLPSGTHYTLMRQGAGRQLVLGGRWGDDEWAIRQSYRRHLLQVGMADKMLGHVLDRLQETGLLDRALIAVTADHGVSFRSGDYRRRLTASNFMDVMPVPLFVKRPGQRAGEIDDRNVETVDLLPTIAGVLGLELPWPVDGVSAVDAERRSRPIKTCFGDAASTAGSLELPASVFAAARRAAVERRERAFGGGDFADLLRAGPHAELVGRALEQLVVDDGAGGLFARLAAPELFRRVDPDSGFVPALVEGFVEPGELEPPLDLAIAVNGTVAATTRTHGESLGGGLLVFSALTPETAFHRGANEVEVLVIRSPDSSGATAPRLVRAAGDEGRPLYTGMRLGSEEIWGVEEAGFHQPERTGGPGAETTIRWTGGAARLVVPLGAGPPPTRLEVDLAFTGKPGNVLAVSVAGRELFRGELPPGAWTRAFDLRALDLAGEVVIELDSDTFVPKRELEGSRDARTLGVAVAGIRLEE